jgi:hypothetical protein
MFSSSSSMISVKDSSLNIGVVTFSYGEFTLLKYTGEENEEAFSYSASRNAFEILLSKLS